MLHKIFSILLNLLTLILLSKGDVKKWKKKKKIRQFLLFENKKKKISKIIYQKKK